MRLTPTQRQLLTELASRHGRAVTLYPTSPTLFDPQRGNVRYRRDLVERLLNAGLLERHRRGGWLADVATITDAGRKALEPR